MEENVFVGKTRDGLRDSISPYTKMIFGQVFPKRFCNIQPAFKTLIELVSI